MLNFSESQSTLFDRYYTKINDINLTQLDTTVKAAFKLEKNLVQLVKICLNFWYTLEPDFILTLYPFFDQPTYFTNVDFSLSFQ